uniref:Ig-like domain-containing protein n=1 Tax=Cynoglossus semilaevis TaxID=244447 RepID=A0A3P8VNU3_CYNSE
MHLWPKTSSILLFISSLCLCVSLTDGSDVTQTPQLWRNKSQSATMHCSHTKGGSYFQMYWYRQRPGQTMEEIVFTTLTPPHQYQSGFSKERYPAEKKDAETGSLTVKTLLPDDSAIYFCSVSQHNGADLPGSETTAHDRSQHYVVYISSVLPCNEIFWGK